MEFECMVSITEEGVWLSGELEGSTAGTGINSLTTWPTIGQKKLGPFLHMSWHLLELVAKKVSVQRIKIILDVAKKVSVQRIKIILDVFTILSIMCV